MSICGPVGFPVGDLSTDVAPPTRDSAPLTGRVTLEGMDATATDEGPRLLQAGLPIRMENAGGSELLLFEAAPGA